MQIVIKLSDKIYDTILDDEMPTNEQMKVIVQRIYEGTPLPKGHGDLIDLEEVRDRYVNIIKVSNSELESLRMLAEILDTSPTIIEAESEVRYADKSR